MLFSLLRLSCRKSLPNHRGDDTLLLVQILTAYQLQCSCLSALCLLKGQQILIKLALLHYLIGLLDFSNIYLIFKARGHFDGK